MSNEIHEKFKSNLLKILQSEIQDYNSGIYKILNFKSTQIRNLINDYNPLVLSEELSTDTYNFLLKFFSLYYEKGSLHYKRRLFENYITNSNENEVLLHWVNKDQHYVKAIDSYNKSGKKSSKDYFIHKDLKGFLKSELNFFIRNEILGFEVLKKLEYEDLQIHLETAKIVEEIAIKLIDFLAQIENLQVLLWNKRNFVLETNYVITLDKIKEYAGESFFEKILFNILNNQEQMEEWFKLFEIKINNKSELAKGKTNKNSKWEHLTIDTKYFDEEFKWELTTALTLKNNLDTILDGILIKSEI